MMRLCQNFSETTHTLRRSNFLQHSNMMSFCNCHWKILWLMEIWLPYIGPTILHCVVTLNICYNWPVPFRATHILQEKTSHACGILKRYSFRVHVSPGSADTLVRRGGTINHHSIAYSLSNISAKNYRNRLLWVESIVCNISVVFSETQCSLNLLKNPT